MPAKATDRWGSVFVTEPTAKGSARSAPSLRSIGGLVGHRTRQVAREMQTRRTNPDHHHQKGFPNTKLPSSPQADLIALAQGKGQVLTENTLRLIRDTLELRGVTLAEFVADVRPHFRNNILNPRGFLIDRARRFHQLSRAAAVPVYSTLLQPETTAVCGKCKGQKYVATEKDIEPCPECSTAEFRKMWEIKQAERAQKIRASSSPSLSQITSNDGQ
jgi:hypothetical protein